MIPVLPLYIQFLVKCTVLYIILKNGLTCTLLYWFAVILTLSLVEIIKRMHTVMYQIRDWLLILNCTWWIVSTNSGNLLCPALC